ncbi:DUF7660 family protein [Arthrospiribacter ruber]|uniref:DUF7660 domain-containing protein n=1 Tax=Arthrospiribacter ruber TaxID=2487934 RepID=A0A951J1U7_9BACT|nr:hypothetical protein [Arthrospiribacter ruber]MBW3469831.1 hypothetical protein [Arthrospiribacter ruber]
MDVYEIYEKIESKKDFENFLEQFRIDLETKPEEWENITLVSFLESLHAYTQDVEGYYKNMNMPFDERRPTWKVFAHLLLGAKVYE